jgi:hypothetical protein
MEGGNLTWIGEDGTGNDRIGREGTGTSMGGLDVNASARTLSMG